MTAGLAALTLRRRGTHCLRQPACSRLPFVCGQTHFCEFATSLHNADKTKKGLKRDLFCFIGAPGGTRTHNLLIRSQMLYPIKLRAQRLDILIEQKKYKCKHFFHFF